jgi:hypothetical protein
MWSEFTCLRIRISGGSYEHGIDFSDLIKFWKVLAAEPL